MNEQNERFARIKQKNISELTYGDLLFLLQKTEYAIQAEPVIKNVAELNEYLSKSGMGINQWGASVIGIATEKLEQFHQENKRLREALEFYADGSNWSRMDIGQNGERAYIRFIVTGDSGNVALKALEGKS